ncbi:alpha/beta fold hydrolase [Williamwhitmania taraxaci]|uniref:Pimeloyl-ACP methyl ester carboxylesterase n=1 Tax=Williamwhitmania taraxaci TaxID=1640674 RepID=A0A1G6H7X6_9BACT|nr:alpha/beta hydrolase [Williamwhitmania taraxaci]SDB90360.1 Pimeloyl-ACP methyl ester carboxylesterase [Williamwhitmania taraxaci]
MEKAITYNGGIVMYADNGQGNPILLLHGYLESQEIWFSFTEKLIKQGHRVITLDLPGHGFSGSVGSEHTMDHLAGAVNTVLLEQKVEKCLVVGHSMGGYVALAFAKVYPEKLAGLCLFHSTPNPDSEEKKANRDREIELIKAGKKELIVKTHIPNAFAKENLKRCTDMVEEATLMALETENEGIIANLNGMKSRPDSTEFLKTVTQPVLMIFGAKDSYIVPEVASELANKFSMHSTVILENSGHMGFIEEEKRSIEIISEFEKKVFGTI